MARMRTIEKPTHDVEGHSLCGVANRARNDTQVWNLISPSCLNHVQSPELATTNHKTLDATSTCKTIPRFFRSDLRRPHIISTVIAFNPNQSIIELRRHPCYVYVFQQVSRFLTSIATDLQSHLMFSFWVRQSTTLRAYHPLAMSRVSAASWQTHPLVVFH